MRCERSRVLVIIGNAILREKVAGVMSRWEEVEMVAQMSGINSLEEALRYTSPGLVLIDVRQTVLAADRLRAARAANPATVFYLVAGQGGRRYEEAARSVAFDGIVVTSHLEQTLRNIVARSGRESAATSG